MRSIILLFAAVVALQIHSAAFAQMRWSFPDIETRSAADLAPRPIKDIVEAAPDEHLTGTHQLTIAVVDDATGEPVAGAVIHGMLARPASEFSSLEAPERFGRGDIFYAWLETKKIEGESSVITFDNLPAVQATLRASAPGHLPETLSGIDIAQANQPLEIRLKLAAEVRGRFVSPHADITFEDWIVHLVEIEDDTDQAERSRPGYFGYAAPDAEGRFRFAPVPPGRYRLWVEGLPYDISKIFEKASRAAREKFGPSSGALTSEQRRLLADEISAELDKPYVMHPPQIETETAAGEAVELGDIALKLVPVLDLTVVDEQGQPLAGFPVKLDYGSGPYFEHKDKFRTGADGRLRLPLIQFEEDTPVVVFLPDRHAEYFAPPPGEAEAEPAPAPTEDGESESVWNEFAREMSDEGRGEARRQLLALADNHPNAAVFRPQPGETIEARLTYKPPRFDLAPQFEFVEEGIGKPVFNVDALLTDEETAARLFLMGDFDSVEYIFQGGLGQMRRIATGPSSNKARVPGLLRPDDAMMARMKKEIAAAMAKENPSPADERLIMAGMMGGIERPLTLAVKAPGKVSWNYTITPEQLRSKAPIRIEIKSGASASGRLVLGSTGEAFTTATLLRLIDAGQVEGYGAEIRGRPDYREQLLRALPRAIGVELSNEFLGGGYQPGRSDATPSFRVSLVDAQGRFHFDNLSPADKWTLKIRVQGFPPIVQRDITLQPGANDLGEFIIAHAAAFSLLVVDEREQPLPGVMLRFPVENRNRHMLEQYVRYQDGRYAVDANKFQEERQILRVAPPWGVRQTEYGSSDDQIWFDREEPIERSNPPAGLRLTAVKGHTLTVKLPPTERMVQLRDFYSKIENQRGFSGGRNSRPHFAIRSVALIALDKDAAGFRYGQFKVADTPGGGRITTTTLALEVAHVPPGRMGMRVDGGFFTGEVYEAITGFPIYYGEFTMPAGNHEIEVAPNEADLLIDLVNTPDGYKERMLNDEVLCLIERVEPHAIGLSGDIQNIMRSVSPGSGREAESLISPVVGYFEAFASTAGQRYQPVTVLAIPPGRYRIVAFRNLYEMSLGTPEGFYSTTIDIPAENRLMRVEVPFAAP